MAFSSSQNSRQPRSSPGFPANSCVSSFQNGPTANSNVNLGLRLSRTDGMYTKFQRCHLFTVEFEVPLYPYALPKSTDGTHVSESGALYTTRNGVALHYYCA